MAITYVTAAEITTGTDAVMLLDEDGVVVAIMPKDNLNYVIAMDSLVTER